MRISTQTIRDLKGERPIAAITAYDSIMGALADRAGADLVLVGDSVGTTLLGFDSTVPVTVEMMLHHTAAVVRGVENALVVGDLPFAAASYSHDRLLEVAAAFMQEAGAGAVKLEGGKAIAGKVEMLTNAGIPVFGHVGLLPQSYHQIGGYRTYGRHADEANGIVEDALALEAAGAFAVVAECVAPEAASLLTEKLSIPVIGIGCGAACDGHIIVITDLLGMTLGKLPSFVKPYAGLAQDIEKVLGKYADDVRAGTYPSV